MSISFTLLFIHGFRSSPQSDKAIMLADAVKARPNVGFRAPQLMLNPLQNITILEQEIKRSGTNNIGLVGSSMGGFYGTYIAEKYGLPLVLINPAIRPYELLKSYLGEVENPYAGEKYTFTKEHIAIFKNLEINGFSDPKQYLLLAQTGDEVLDYRQCMEKFSSSQQYIEEGGSHSFEGFERYIPVILEFFKL